VALGADLGTAADPGANTLRGTYPSGTVRFKSGIGAAQLQAVGNVWNPFVQGAGGTGRYGPAASVDGTSSLATGTNFSLQAGQSIQLG
jgi:hypothetical protein